MQPAGFLLIASALAMQVACGGERPQRIVLVTIDTLRWDAFASPDGGTRMRETRALAGRGLVFERFYATTSVTQPTHASLFTGLHPWEHGVTRNGQVLGARFRTIAEILRERGFATRAVVGSFPLHSRFGFGQGFDAFDESFEETYRQTWEGHAVSERRFFSLATGVTDRALQQLDSAQEDLQFFWIHYFDPHDPYGDGASRTETEVVKLRALLELSVEGGDAFRSALDRARAAYARDVEAVDAQLGRLFRRLAEDSVRFETHIVVTADHGESFGEKGALGHGRRATTEQLRVPLVLVSPRVEPGVRREAASSIDIPATLVSLAGMDPDLLPGNDLTRPAASDAAVLGMRRTFPEPVQDFRTGGGAPVVLSPRWFFSVEDGVVYAGDGEQIYVEDDLEQPVTGTRAARLRGVFGELSASLQATRSDELVDEEVREGLEALGYVQ